MPVPESVIMVRMVSPPCYVNHSFLATAVPAAGSVPARKLQHGRILLDHIEHLAIGSPIPITLPRGAGVARLPGRP
jgi:hypothetical protein